MKIKYFSEGSRPEASFRSGQDTDTLYIEFRGTEAVETRDLDEDTLLDIDKDGNICAITVEHAKVRTNIPQFSFEQIAA